MIGFNEAAGNCLRKWPAGSSETDDDSCFNEAAGNCLRKFTYCKKEAWHRLASMRPQAIACGNVESSMVTPAPVASFNEAAGNCLRKSKTICHRNRTAFRFNEAAGNCLRKCGGSVQKASSTGHASMRPQAIACGNGYIRANTHQKVECFNEAAGNCLRK